MPLGFPTLYHHHPQCSGLLKHASDGDAWGKFISHPPATVLDPSRAPPSLSPQVFLIRFNGKLHALLQFFHRPQAFPVVAGKWTENYFVPRGLPQVRLSLSDGGSSADLLTSARKSLLEFLSPRIFSHWAAVLDQLHVCTPTGSHAPGTLSWGIMYSGTLVTGPVSSHQRLDFSHFRPCGSLQHVEK